MIARKQDSLSASDDQRRCCGGMVNLLFDRQVVFGPSLDRKDARLSGPVPPPACNVDVPDRQPDASAAGSRVRSDRLDGTIQVPPSSGTSIT